MDTNLKKLTKKTLSLLITVFMVITSFVNPVSVKAEPKEVGSFKDLETAIDSAADGDVIIITKNIAMEKTIEVTRKITIKGKDNGYTLYQKLRESGPYETMFVVGNGGNLTLGEKLTLSGKIGSCTEGTAPTLDIFLTTKDYPGNAEPEEHTETTPNPNKKSLDDFKKTDAATYTGTISGIYLRDATSGKALTTKDQGTGAVTFTIDNQGRVKVGNEYFECPNWSTIVLKTAEPSKPLLAHDSSGNIYSGGSEVYLYTEPGGGYVEDWRPEDGVVLAGLITDAAAKKSASMTSSGGSTYWMIPDPDDNYTEKKYTNENDAKAALKKYNDEFPDTTTTYYTVPGQSEPQYNSKEDDALVSAMETYNEENPVTKDVWKFDDEHIFIKPDEQAQAEAYLEEYKDAHPSQGSCTEACPLESNAYTVSNFDSGNTDNPHGFFVEVSNGGKATLDGATLENFNTSRSKDDTPKFVAPVVAKYGGEFNIISGSIKNNIVGYIVKDSESNQNANAIKMYIKGAAPNAQRTEKGKALRRNVEAGIDGDEPGSGITGTAGAVIYASGGKGTVSGGDISFNRGDTGGIFVTGEGSQVKLEEGTDINNNVGVQFGGGTTVEDGGFINMTGGIIRENVAWFGGGAVYATENGTKWLLGNKTINQREDGWFTMTGGTLDSNTAFTRGGAILADSDGVALMKGKLTNNMARMLGGAMYVMGDHPDFTYTVYIDKGYVHGNKAISAGYKDTVASNPNINIDKDNEKLSKQLVEPCGCDKELNSLFDADMTVNSDDLVDGYPDNQAMSTDGTGGGVWLCSYGNTTIDLSENSQFYISGNTATGSVRNKPISAPGKGGDDFHKDTRNNGSLVVTGITADDQWLDQNSGDLYTSPDGDTNSIHDSSLRNLKNVGNSKPAGYNKDTYDGVDISGNISRRGGGLAADGAFAFGNVEDIAQIYSELKIKKSWYGDIEKKPVLIKLFVESDKDGKVEIGEVELTGTAQEASELDVAFDEGTDDDGNYVGRFILPAFVEKRNDETNEVKMVPVYDLLIDGVKANLSTTEGLTELAKAINDSSKNVTLSTEGRKIVFEEYLITGYDPEGKPITEKAKQYLLSSEGISLKGQEASIKTIQQKQTDGSVVDVITSSLSELYFDTDIKNDRIPEIEKYVNQAVHKDIKFDDEFTYDIIAYVTSDADKVTITDVLGENLDFVSKPTDVVILDLGTSVNHKVTNDIDGKVINTDASVAIVEGDTITTGTAKKITGAGVSVSIDNDTKELKVVLDGNPDSTGIHQNEVVNNLHGHWVKVTFKAKLSQAAIDKTKAKLEPEYKEIKNGEVLPEDEDRAEENKGNLPVLSEKDHTGIINNASYAIDVGHKVAAHSDKSNTVTVKPEFKDFEVDKKWLINGEDAEWPDGATVEVILKNGEDVVATAELSKNQHSYTFSGIQVYENSDYKVVEGEVTGAGKFKAIEPTTQGNKTTLRNAIEEEPEIEKYVNKAVHDFVSLDEVFTYDIIAYVTEDADKVEITDTLDDVLEFVGDASEVASNIKVVSLKTNNHKVTNNIYSEKVNNDADVANEGTPIQIPLDAPRSPLIKEIEGQTLKVTIDDYVNPETGVRECNVVKNLRGKWVKITFDAQIKKEIQDKINSGEMTLDQLADKYQFIDHEQGESRHKPNVGNDPVLSDEDHLGIPNNASYILNNDVDYGDESNTVTVEPEKPEIEKYVNQAVHKDIDLDEVFNYDIVAYITKDADSFTITDELVDYLEFVDEVTIAQLGNDEIGYDNNHKPYYDIAGDSIEGNDDASVAQEGNDIPIDSEGVEVVVDTENNLLTVTFDDVVTADEETGIISREYHIVEKLRGTWVRVSFRAQIKQELQERINNGEKIEEVLTFVEIKDNEKEDWRDVPNVGNDPVLSNEDHKGILNDASYEIKVNNKFKYEDTSNTVTVKPDEPEIEKYVNQAVHKEIMLDEVFTYDIVGYVTHNADKVVFTDTLVEDLEFVSTDMDVVISYLDDDNHMPYKDINDNVFDPDASIAEEWNVIDVMDVDGIDISIDDNTNTLTVTLDDDVDPETGKRTHETVKGLRNQYVKVTFQAQINKDYQDAINAGEKSLDDLSNVEVTDNGIVETGETHDGIGNKAEMKITVDDGGKFELETNVVTVKPDKPEIEKYVNQAVHKDIDLDEVFTFDVIAYITKNADRFTITDTLVDDLEFVSTKIDDVKVYDLGTENNHKVVNDIAGDEVNDPEDTTVGKSDVTEITENINISIEDKDNTLTVSMDDGVTNIDGVINRDRDDVKKLRGHWVKVSFDAQIKEEYQRKIENGEMTLEDLTYVTIIPDEVFKSDNSIFEDDNRPSPNVDNDPVESDEEHEGIENTASYEIGVFNNGEYTSSYDESNTVTVKPQLLTISGTKTWDDEDDKDGLRPDSVTIILLADGEEIDRVEASKDTGWSYEFTDLVKRKDGKEIEYTVDEVEVEGYEKFIFEYDITNQHVPEDEPKKLVNGKHEFTLTNRDEVMTYTITARVPTKTVQLSMEDELPEALELVSATFSEEGVKVKVDGQLIKVEITDKELLKELTGKVLTLTVKARIKSSISDEELIRKYGNGVDNIATVTINNKPKKTKGASFTPKKKKDKPKKYDIPKTGIYE